MPKLSWISNTYGSIFVSITSVFSKDQSACWEMDNKEQMLQFVFSGAEYFLALLIQDILDES